MSATTHRPARAAGPRRGRGPGWSTRSSRVALNAGALLLALGACAESERSGTTADSAVLQSAALDSARRAGDSPPPPVADDSAAGDSAGVDGAAADSSGSPARRFVLIADSAAGDSLYRRGALCLTCHGVRGEGVPNLGPNLRDSLWLTGDGSVTAIERIVIEGVAEPKALRVQMPSFGTRLQPGDAHRIATYVYTLSHPGMTLADTTAVADSLLTPPGATPLP